MEKFALITGATSGIGRELANQLADDDYNLVLVARKAEELSLAAEELSLRRSDIKVVSIAKDLTEDKAAEEIFKEINDKNISIDLLVNDAGVGQGGAFNENQLEKDLYIIQLNIVALTKLTKLFLPALIKKRSGGILNLGSVAGFQPGPLMAVYHASKAYVNSFSEALAEELKDTGVTVTCLCPGPTATNFFERADLENSRVAKNAEITMMSAEDVAKGGYQAFKDGERIYVAGAMNKIMTFMRRVIPISLQAKQSKKFYETVEE